MSEIYRTVYQIEVLSEGPLDVRGDSTDPFDLQAINYAITDGECIGNVEQVSQEVVPTDKVKTELLRMGNDGLFFDYLGEDFDGKDV